ncbi:cerberus [Hydra vulgaris]|uniref:cerberus n=1 Tax=Hydra vulgaris TaxID=6087 RepID=UPI001F5EB3FE|nr:cerberus isoform X2 [Hydra vulgaris]
MAMSFRFYYFPIFLLCQLKLKQCNLVAPLSNQEEICKSITFIQPIIREGCDTIMVENSYCVGSCKSVTSISTDTNINPSNFSYYCDAAEIHEEKFQLNCNSRKKKNLTKIIAVVKSCKCKAQIL